jgi:hypothetical protein
MTNAYTFRLGTITGAAALATGSGTNQLTFSNGATADFVGSVQVDTFQDHVHPVPTTNGGGGEGGGANGIDYVPYILGLGAVNARVSSETRPVNTGMHYIMKY